MNLRIVFIFILILSSCDKQDTFDCIQSIGHPITKEFIIDNFDEVLVNENIELTVKVGSLFSLRIQTGSNMMSDVNYRIQDGILILKDENRCNWVRSYAPTKVTVVAPEEEVRVGFEILKSLGLRNRGVKIISCPSCARQQFEVIKTVKNLEKKLDDISTPITVSIIGCVVNGPGEATMTNIGITGGGNDTHMIYLDGKKNNVVKNVDLENYLEDLIRKKTKEIELSN